MWATALRDDLLGKREKDGTWRHRTPQFKGPDHRISNEIWATANALVTLKAVEGLDK